MKLTRSNTGHSNMEVAIDALVLSILAIEKEFGVRIQKNGDILDENNQNVGNLSEEMAKISDEEFEIE